MPDASAITAVLGPTNTGKTHRAIERMLSHDSGMIGLPLRLLAREVYDRVTRSIGEARVALVTGEEKRVPKRADYWICTVEAMPLDRDVDFLAVDEIQLAAHDERGHVFTHRMLSMRGRRETWLLGSDTMRPLVSELVPTARVESHPRLSKLSWSGSEKLSHLPPRSAVVAFSTEQVYALAERVKALRGGAAVVLGALSPRTRNAQVAMFQAGEVDAIVATDAIGMGLNLDVRHVAFAGLRKFDGRDVRALEASEIAQIAGRAGRYVTDGSFGTLAPLALSDDVARAVEAHHFPSVTRLRYRNAKLEFGSIEALVESLHARPPSQRLHRTDDAEDARALARLAEREAVRKVARGSDAVELLWDVCRIPDFRKLLTEVHVALLAVVYAQLTSPKGKLDTDWVASQVRELDDTRGDCDTLLARIAAIRTWTYVAHQSRWMGDAEAWQAETRNVEDRLSDALHERLVQRFIERSAKSKSLPSAPRPRASEPRASTPSDPDASHPFAALRALRAKLAPEAPESRPGHDPWVESLVLAPHRSFELIDNGFILFDGRRVARLARGPSLLRPETKLVGLEQLGEGSRLRIQRRVVAWSRDFIEGLFSSCDSTKTRGLSAPARGLIYQLEQGLGTLLTSEASAQIAELSEADRLALASLGVTLGTRVAFVPSLLTRRAIDARQSLLEAHFDSAHIPRPAPGAVSLRLDRRADDRVYMRLGYPVFGPRAVRADVAERVANAPDGAPLSSWLGCTKREVEAIVEAVASAHPRGA